MEAFTDPNEKAEFFFTRLLYSGDRGWGWRGGWSTDYPEADYHFMQGVRRLTLIDAGGFRQGLCGRSTMRCSSVPGSMRSKSATGTWTSRRPNGFASICCAAAF